jgi:methylase of polypeptide subunit release factors
MEFSVPTRPNFRICHHSADDGGGSWFGQEYVNMLQTRYDRRWQHCLEWCSGPGFIGFGILANGLCDRLTLQDRHAPLANHIAETMAINSVQDRVDFYAGPTLACIPPCQFDLVVANPPHYLECPGDENYQRLAVDPGWAAHENFFQLIPRYLAPDGVIVLQENQAGSLSGPSEFWHMIHCNGLKITAYWTSPQFWEVDGPTQIYYIEIRHWQKKSQ